MTSQHSWIAFRQVGNEPTIRTAALILAALRDEGPAAETELARRTGIRRQRVTELCRRMLDVGWVTIDQADRIALADVPPSLR